MSLKNSGRISVQRTSSLIHAPTPPNDRVERIIYSQCDISGCEFHLKLLAAMQCWKKNSNLSELQVLYHTAIPYILCNKTQLQQKVFILMFIACSSAVDWPGSFECFYFKFRAGLASSLCLRISLQGSVVRPRQKAQQLFGIKLFTRKSERHKRHAHITNLIHGFAYITDSKHFIGQSKTRDQFRYQ